jgi:hypothetical protein
MFSVPVYGKSRKAPLQPQGGYDNAPSRCHPGAEEPASDGFYPLYICFPPNSDSIFHALAKFG